MNSHGYKSSFCPRHGLALREFATLYSWQWWSFTEKQLECPRCREQRLATRDNVLAWLAISLAFALALAIGAVLWRVT